MIPGEYKVTQGTININEGRDTVSLIVANKGDRPVQVGSHFHFFEVNKALAFERMRAFGMRLDIPSGTAVRFEPGEEKPVTLVRLGGRRHVYGLNGLTNGCTDSSTNLPNMEQRLEQWIGGTENG